MMSDHTIYPSFQDNHQPIHHHSMTCRIIQKFLPRYGDHIEQKQPYLRLSLGVEEPDVQELWCVPRIKLRAHSEMLLHLIDAICGN